MSVFTIILCLSSLREVRRYNTDMHTDVNVDIDWGRAKNDLQEKLALQIYNSKLAVTFTEFLVNSHPMDLLDHIVTCNENQPEDGTETPPPKSNSLSLMKLDMTSWGSWNLTHPSKLRLLINYEYRDIPIDFSYMLMKTQLKFPIKYQWQWSEPLLRPLPHWQNFGNYRQESRKQLKSQFLLPSPSQPLGLLSGRCCPATKSTRRRNKDLSTQISVWLKSTQLPDLTEGCCRSSTRPQILH